MLSWRLEEWADGSNCAVEQPDTPALPQSCTGCSGLRHADAGSAEAGLDRRPTAPLTSRSAASRLRRSRRRRPAQRVHVAGCTSTAASRFLSSLRRASGFSDSGPRPFLRPGCRKRPRPNDRRRSGNRSGTSALTRFRFHPANPFLKLRLRSQRHNVWGCSTGSERPATTVQQRFARLVLMRGRLGSLVVVVVTADQAQRGGVPIFGEPLQQNIVVSKAVAFGFF